MGASVILSPPSILQFFNNAGQPNSGGSILTQVGGVNYPTYQDSGGNTALPNPIPLNSRGEISNTSGISCQLFLATGVTYVFTQYDVNGNQINQATWVGSSAIQASDYALGNLNRVVSSIAALRALPHTFYTAAFVTGYYSAHDGGGGSYQYDASDTTSADNGGTVIVAADGARWKLQVIGSVCVRQFGAKGDNVTDDTAHIANAITWCTANGICLRIAENDDTHVVSAQLVFNTPVEVRSDATAALRFTNTASCGILLNFGTASNQALATLCFPQLYSPAINSSKAIPGYGPTSYTYNLNSRVGNAIFLQGGNRVNIFCEYASGWNAACQVSGTTTSSVDNVNVEFNTIDFCVYGVATYAAASGSENIASLVWKANTVWAKYPIYIDGTNQNLVASEFHITGQAFTNEVNGSIIYGQNISGTCDTCKFVVNWAAAGYAADSTSGTPTNLINPFLAGSASSNGQTTDGNATLGYWNGQFCEFEIGPIMGYGGGVPAASPVPAAGNTIRIRDVGAFNLVTMRYSDSVNTSPIPVATTQGEANYNGGVGAAQYSKRVFCSASVPALGTGVGSAIFYVYHQRISLGSIKQVSLEPFDGSLSTAGLMMWAESNAAAGNNREIKLQFANTRSTTSTATTVYFWLVIQ